MKQRILLAMIAATACGALAIADNRNGDGSEEKKEKDFEAYNARITGDSVNIRSGPGVAYTAVTEADEGYIVLVTGTEGGWTQIRMPYECLLWIHRDYVNLDEDTDIGAVTGDNVNVRIAPRLGTTVVGQVDEGMYLVVTGEDGDWFEIRSPSTASAYVYSDYVERIKVEK
jgi:N-acetylmuramoyl-L-alanine amidase